MTDDEKQLFKATAESALKPFANLVETLFGGAADQIGGMLGDALYARRFNRRIKLYSKMKQRIEESGIDPQEIPEKVWFPALQAASLEDDETLQDKWASLLANASNPESPAAVAAMFPKVLANLTAREAKILDLYFDGSLKNIPKQFDSTEIGQISFFSRIEVGHAVLFFDLKAFDWRSEEAVKTFGRFVTEGLVSVVRTFDDLGAQRLAVELAGSKRPHEHLSSKLKSLFKEQYELTPFGVEFVLACRPPHKRALSSH